MAAGEAGFFCEVTPMEEKNHNQDKEVVSPVMNGEEREGDRSLAEEENTGPTCVPQGEAAGFTERADGGETPGEGSAADKEATPEEEAAGTVDVAGLERRLAEATARAQDYFQRLARMQADFENYRRRVNREREDWARYAAQSLVAELLPVLDNLERALAAKGEDPAGVIAGVEMIHRHLQEVLSREGLTPVPTVGEPFDPAKHEAVMQVETGDYPDNTVVEELRRGYYYKDRLLRPAMVKVARGGPQRETQGEHDKTGQNGSNC